MNSIIVVRNNELSGRELEVQLPVMNGPVVALANNVQDEPRLIFSGDRKADRIPGAIGRQSGTGCCITKIAGLLELLWQRADTIMTGSSTVAPPPGA